MKKIAAVFFAVTLFSSALFAEKNLVVNFSLYGNQKNILTDENTGASRMIYKDDKITGLTSILADKIHERVGGDTLFIETEERYADGYMAVLKACKAEQGNHIPITTKADLSEYDNIFLGYPTWWSDLPMGVYTFLEENDFTGKNIYLFCTSGGSGFVKTIDAVKNTAKGAKVSSVGLHIYQDDVKKSDKDIDRWLKDIGIN